MYDCWEVGIRRTCSIIKDCNTIFFQSSVALFKCAYFLVFLRDAQNPTPLMGPFEIVSSKTSWHAVFDVKLHAVFHMLAEQVRANWCRRPLRKVMSQQ